MKDEVILLIIYYSYLLISKREYFFNFIYSALIISNVLKMVNFFFCSELKFGKKFLAFIQIIIYYLISYYLIKDPNPFYYLLTFFLPFPNLFRGIFIVIFISYCFNNTIYKIESNKEKGEPKKRDDIKDGEKQNNNKEITTNKIYSFFLSKYLLYFYNNKMNFLLFLLVLIIIRILIYFYNIYAKLSITFGFILLQKK